MRSKWKGINYINILFKIKILKVSRDIIVLPIWIGKTIKVYNGKVFSFLKVKKSMVGFKFGEFSFSKKMTNSIHLKEKKKNKKK